MKQLPSNVVAYKRTDVFTEISVPKGLLNNHRTMANVWAKIIVVEGTLLYQIMTNPVETIELSPECFGIVEPEQIHFVEPKGKVLFYVEFYK